MRKWEDLADRDLIAILVERASDEDMQQACAELYRRYEEALLRYAATALRTAPGTKLEAVDVVQETFAHLLKKGVCNQFDPARPLRPWLRGILFHKAHDLLRKDRHHQVALQVEGIVDGRADHPESLVVTRDTVEALMRDLSPDERKLCQLYYMEEKPAQVVAQDLGWDVARVYRVAHKLSHLLREKLRRLGAS